MKLTKEMLKRYDACECGYKWYLKNGCDTVEKTMELLLSSGKTDWADWLIARVLKRKHKIMYAIYAAEQVIDLYEKEYPKDDRPRNAIEVAKEYLKNPNKGTKKAAYATVYADAYAAAYATAYAVYDAYAAAYSSTKMKCKIIKYGLTLLRCE